MIKVKKDEKKVVLEGTAGMTVRMDYEGVYDLDGYYMYDVKVAKYIDMTSPLLQTVYLYGFEDGDVEIDVSDEIYKKWINEVRKPYLIEQALAKHHADCEKIEKGRMVKVVSGRKVPIGAIGVVFWMGEVNYDPYKRWCNATKRVGFKADDGETYWTDARNVEVLDPTNYYEDDRIIEEVNKQIEWEGELA